MDDGGAVGWRVWLECNGEPGDARLTAKAESLGAAARLREMDGDGGLNLLAHFEVDEDVPEAQAVEIAMRRFLAAGRDGAATWYIGVRRVEPRYATPRDWDLSIAVLPAPGIGIGYGEILDHLAAHGFTVHVEPPTEPGWPPGRWLVMTVEATSLGEAEERARALLLAHGAEVSEPIVQGSSRAD
jgi:hypothetical protein